MDTKEKIIHWLLADDTGVSSIAIASKMTGREPLYGYGVPHDQDDFGRCHRLLEAIPEFMVRIEEMAECSPQWAVLVKHWHELTQLYLSNPEEMHDRLYQLITAAPDENRVELGNGLAVELMGKD
ncbi:hypothetical protein [Nitrosomonas oligotropha]|uniref:hypothetical protein n=1 Tax=Nitrosomonas oligotropha TaxID=42354 RepID=UPI00136DE34B|nr:hypothetical protein [Nitrosomonas oligotropha]MXS82249.1 hypothetical protein [Nitrosomonas oligotropha]